MLFVYLKTPVTDCDYTKYRMPEVKLDILDPGGMTVLIFSPCLCMHVCNKTPAAFFSLVGFWVVCLLGLAFYFFLIYYYFF